MKKFILNNNIDSYTDLGIRITSPPILPTTQRIIDTIEVDGREGSLTLLKGWEDITITFRAALSNKMEWGEVLSIFQTAETITLSTDNTVYYKIKHVKTSGLTHLLSNLWEFELEIRCAPFRYLNNVSNINRTSSGTVQGYGNIYSQPKITVYGTGSRTLTINGKPIVLNILNGHLILDSELKECYYGNVAQNQNMTGDFPILTPTTNQVTLGTGITKVEIEARWRYL
ncbi:Phage-related protein [Pilibacter termitis]|uniref:Phage-related protein n=1 Tax=Pilibacter termitis TaxID=263852 RepID=A0A1T4R694_9ENTE|nr:phage tail protein [Pilibacter termitis]SKA11602.1 Phage-related protein [Pilibacter termitis]